MGEFIAKAMTMLLSTNTETNRLAAMTATALDGVSSGLGTSKATENTWTATFERREDAELFAWAIASLCIHMAGQLETNDDPK